MSKVILISGPAGAGKTAVARRLIPLLPGPVAYIEGDVFWSFIQKSDGRGKRENFMEILRAMTAAAIPFARSGYAVLLDFSIPPDFLPTARKILKEVPLEFVIVRPRQAVCDARAAARPEGAIADYSAYASFYQLFDGFEPHTLRNDDLGADVAATQIVEGLNNGKFRVA